MNEERLKDEIVWCDQCNQERYRSDCQKSGRLDYVCFQCSRGAIVRVVHEVKQEEPVVAPVVVVEAAQPPRQNCVVVGLERRRMIAHAILCDGFDIFGREAKKYAESTGMSELSARQWVQKIRGILRPLDAVERRATLEQWLHREHPHSG